MAAFSYPPITATSANTAVLQGYIDGLILSYSTSSVFGIGVGVATDVDVTSCMSLASAYTKSYSAWAVGTGNGSLDTGAVAVSTWYHVFVIQRSDTGVVDILISLSSSAPTMPTNYGRKRRIGSIYVDAAGLIQNFSQVGDEFLWRVPLLDGNNFTIATTETLVTLTVPLGVKVTATFTLYTQSAGSNYATVTSPDITDAAPAATGAAGIDMQGSSVSPIASWLRVRTNTSSQIRTRATGGTIATCYLSTKGWIDPRGKNA